MTPFAISTSAPLPYSSKHLSFSNLAAPASFPRLLQMSYASRRTGGASNQKKVAAERNQQILRTLMKDPANKFCADCKVSGHPRWASWSLGIFVCIRCSGIHRSMGTHISKVRSIDLDSWSDEQVEPLVRWGNKRANLYWEAKLPDGYVPDDSKIENFIRTKYDLKRWVLTPQLPKDPSVLDTTVAAAENQPLSEVRKRLTDNKRPAVPPPQQKPSQPKQKPAVDLLDGDFLSSRAPPTTATQRQTVVSSGNTTSLHQQPQQQAKPQPPPKPSTSLMGLDFGAPANPSPQASQPQQSASQNSRPDLKKSILSLYSTPSSNYQQPLVQQQQQQQQQQSSFGGSNLDILSGLGTMSLDNRNTPASSYDRTGSNNFGTPSSTTQPQPSSHQKKPSAFDDLLSGGASNWSSLSSPKSPSAAFNSFNSTSSNTQPAAASTSFGFGAAKPANTFQQPASQPFNTGLSNEWSSMSSASAPAPQPKGLNNDDDLFTNVWK